MSWLIVASGVVALAYAIAAGLYVWALLRPAQEAQRDLGWGALVVGMVAHAGVLCWAGVEQGGGALLTIQYGLSALALMLGVGFAVVRTAYALTTIATLITPLMVLLQATGAAMMTGQDDAAPQGLLGTLLAVHIGSALMGTAAFVLAAGAGVLYLVQERNLKRKTFGPMFNRLPSVGVLDRVSLRLVLIGFPVYTLAIALGALWAWRSTASWTLQIQYVFALVSWLVYAVILHARLTAGWRGRRAAMLALMGLVGVGGVLAAYLVRALTSAGGAA